LLSPTITALSPKVGSLCFVGAPHTGKNFLANCLAGETKASILTLTPEKTANYSKKDAQELINVILQVVKKNPPTIIFLKNAEKLFYKKVPKSEKPSNPSLLGKIIITLKKKIKADHRILIVGTTTEPWTAKHKTFCKIFDVFLNVPTRHYGSHLAVCQSELPTFEGHEVSAVAKITSTYGFTFDAIEKCVTFGKNKLNQTNIASIVEKMTEAVPDLNDNEKKIGNFMEKTPQIVKSKKLVEVKQK